MKKWLLLLHQIPPKPAYFRAKVLRRLTQLGALAIKNSAYLLPVNDETFEDLQWVRREIEEQGGEAWLFRTEAVAGLSDNALCEAFQSLREPDYAELAAAAHKLLDAVRAGAKNHSESEWRRLKRRYEEVRRVDFFGAPGRDEMETLMDTIDRILHAPKEPAEQPALADLKGRTWVTRRGVKVDRIGSAWLIRRFIDPAAKFIFVDPQQYKHAPAEIRFDMFEGEFTHEGDLCTFEVLLKRSGNDDPALQAIAEVVHDIDLKETKYQRTETVGIAPLIEGIVLQHADDQHRLEVGATICDALYARYKAGTGQ